MVVLRLFARRSASLLAKPQYHSRLSFSRPISQRKEQLCLPIQKRFLTQSSLLAEDHSEIPASSETSEFNTSSQASADPESESTNSQLSDLAEVNEAFNTSQPPKHGRMELPPTQRVYLGNIFFEATEESLKQFADPVGEVQEVAIHRDRRGLSKGYGFVTFKHLEDAKKAVDVLAGKIFMGRRLTVNYTISKERPYRERSAPSRTLYIGNISFSMTDKDLSNLFRPIKSVIDVRVAIDRRTGQPRGYAHADFLDIASATQAMKELQQIEMYGRRLFIDYSKTPASSNLRQAPVRKELEAKEEGAPVNDPQATAQESAEGNAEESSEESAQESSPIAEAANTQEAIQETPEETAQENAADALEDSISDTTQQQADTAPEAQSSVASEEQKP